MSYALVFIEVCVLTALALGIAWIFGFIISHAFFLAKLRYQRRFMREVQEGQTHG